MGSRVRIRLVYLLRSSFFLLPFLNNSKYGVDDRGHRLRICQALRLSKTKSNSIIITFSKFESP